MTTLRFLPMAAWPYEITKRREVGAFRVSYDKLIKGFLHELGCLNAKEVTLSTLHGAHEVRRDGFLYANAKMPSMPGVSVSFVSRYGPLSFSCDTYKTWLDNLRAITKHMESLRSIDRWGVVKHGEQYKGFLALPAPSQVQSSSARAGILLTFAGIPDDAANRERCVSDGVYRTQIYRQAAKRVHPDLDGGNDTDFITVQECYEVLENR